MKPFLVGSYKYSTVFEAVKPLQTRLPCGFQGLPFLTPFDYILRCSNYIYFPPPP